MNSKNRNNHSKSPWNWDRISRYFRIIYDVSWNIILFFLILGLLGIFFVIGTGAGYFASLVKDEDIRPPEEMIQDIYNYEETSKLYFSNDVFLSDVRADLHREEVELADISPTLIQAVIATEDEYFTEHKGVVPKAIIRALFQEATNADMKTGGSTLTQQLIKNQILTDEVSFDRKAKEILLALRLERFFEKNEILEAYLNIIPYGREASGRNIAGVQTAARGIFGIDVSKVNLPQAAFLAGLPQSPYNYTPFLQKGGLKSKEGLEPGIKRMKVVLKRMYDLGYITEDEYEEAVNYDIVADFIEYEEQKVDSYGYVIDEIQDRAKNILKQLLAKEDGYTLQDLEDDESLDTTYENLAKRELQTGGYQIHSTIDKDIYDQMQKVVKEYPYFGPDRTIIEADEETGELVEKIEPVQVGAMLIENETGRIISFVGGREYNTENVFNYATLAKRSTGSTMKPLLSFGVAMEKGYIQPGTPVADIPTEIPDPGSEGGVWKPKNYTGRYYGIVPARTALAYSYNVSTIKLYKMIEHEDPVREFLYEKMNMKTLNEFDFTSVGSVSIGQLSEGVTVEANTNAFATFANYGNYVPSYMIEKIISKDGEIIYEHQSEPVKVFSPTTAYLTMDMMRDVLKYGTATYIPTQLKDRNVDWVGKTGTTDAYWDAWFVGLNPKVTLGLWLGYDTPHDLTDCRGCTLSYSQRANKLWSDLVNAAAEIDPERITPKEKFKRPKGIVERSICAISGLLPSKLCKEVGLTYTDLFDERFVPTEVDNSLMEGSYVLVDGKAVLAGSQTPREFVKNDGLTFNPDFLKKHQYDQLDDLTILFPQTNRHLWEKIGLPNTEIGDLLEDDGKQPVPPTSVRTSKKKLTWTKSKSKDVIGYRIYAAFEEDGKFQLIGHTTETEFELDVPFAIIHVTAVDYFGLESEASKEVIFGELPDVEDEDEDENDRSKDSRDEKENSKKKPPKKDVDRRKNEDIPNNDRNADE